MLKHVGRLSSTDAKVVVVYMQIPGKEDHALVCESNALPDRMHDAVMRALESKTGQAAQNLGEYFGRQFLSDMGCDIMTGLHRAGRLRPVPVTDVQMVPSAGHAYPLNEILRNMGKLPEAGIPVDAAKYGDPNDTKFNPHAHNHGIDESEDALQSAKGRLAQANMLQMEANKIKEDAYRMAPSLRPQSQAAKKSEVDSAEVLVEEKKTTRTAPTKKTTTRKTPAKKAATKKVTA